MEVLRDGVELEASPRNWPDWDGLEAAALVSLEVDGVTWWVSPTPEGYCLGSTEGPGSAPGSFYPANSTCGGASKSPWTTHMLGGLLPPGAEQVVLEEEDRVLTVAECKSGAWIAVLPGTDVRSISRSSS